MKKREETRGITLVALVVTIIVLLILAGTTIITLIGDDGIIKKAQEAAEKTQGATQSELQGINDLADKINTIIGESENDTETGQGTPTTVADAKPNLGEEVYIFDNTTLITDDTGDNVWIPGGFSIHEDSATDVDNGIVITDGTNEFVWIPVADYTTMYEEVTTALQLTGVTTTTNVYSKIRIRNGDTSKYTAGVPNTTNLREPDLLSSYDTDAQYYQNILEYNNVTEMADALVLEYESTYNSIKEHRGFYIGRYELTGTVDNPTVQKGQTVLSASGSLAKNWYNLKKACTKLVSTDYAQTTMVYGNQWDEIMNWLVMTGKKTEEEIYQDSSSWGNYNDNIVEGAGTKKVSGYSETWKVNNIYDIAGNYLEWTQEAYDIERRVSRGGDSNVSGASYPASVRDNYYPYYSYSRYSTRPALYIK